MYDFNIQIYNLDNVNEYVVCGSDVFLMCVESGKLRKLSLFTLKKAIEKLHWRQCYMQVTFFIFFILILHSNILLLITFYLYYSFDFY